MTEQQELVVDKKEVELIRSIFNGNEKLLKAMRSVMLDISPTSDEKQMVKGAFSNKTIHAVLSHRFYPTLESSKDSPVGQLSDVWLGVESMIFGQPESTIKQAIEYKERALAMTQLALDLLIDPEGEKPRTHYKPSEVVNDPLGIDLQARNMFIRHVDKQLVYLWVIAHQDAKEDVAKRLEKDSAQ